MRNSTKHAIITFLISSVWIINGAYCKVLGMVERHQDIVERVSHFDRPSAYFLTKLIGILEILMVIWIITRIKSKFNAIVQIIVIATMNILEFILAPDLLLWGKFNSVFAFLFILLIYYNEFHLKPKTIQPN